MFYQSGRCQNLVINSTALVVPRVIPFKIPDITLDINKVLADIITTRSPNPGLHDLFSILPYANGD